MATPSDSASDLYARLPTSDAAVHIRVLHLLPGFWHQKIRTSLERVDLLDEPYFEALSYTWGASHLGRTIRINSADAFAVTDNLFNALRRLRSVFVTRVLWIDQLCINQDDIDERSRQVAIMADIYSRASAVNVWLGESGWTIPLTLEFRWPPKSAIWRWSARDYWLWLRTVQNRPKMIDKAISASTPRWHDRVWTVQEFVVARKTYFWDCSTPARLS